MKLLQRQLMRLRAEINQANSHYQMAILVVFLSNLAILILSVTSWTYVRLGVVPALLDIAAVPFGLATIHNNFRLELECDRIEDAIVALEDGPDRGERPLLMLAQKAILISSYVSLALAAVWISVIICCLSLAP